MVTVELNWKSNGKYREWGKDLLRGKHLLRGKPAKFSWVLISESYLLTGGLLVSMWKWRLCSSILYFLLFLFFFFQTMKWFTTFILLNTPECMHSHYPLLPIGSVTVLKNSSLLASYEDKSPANLIYFLL